MEVSYTTDQYQAINQLEHWYRKYQHSFFELVGPIYTGLWQVVQVFLDWIGFDPREVMYLGYNQKQVLELASKRYHAYYLPGFLYRYSREVNFDSLPLFSQTPTEVEFQWVKDTRKKIDRRYRIIIVLDAGLMSEDTLRDVSSFGLPVLLLRDPFLLPAANSYLYEREGNAILTEPVPDLIQNPIYFMAYQILQGTKLTVGSYENVQVIHRNTLQFHNLRNSSMNLVMCEETRKSLTEFYRERIYRERANVIWPNERVFVESNQYQSILVNPDEKHVKVYLMHGLTGTLSKVNRHQPITRYVRCEFSPDCYHEPFQELYMDRNSLNRPPVLSRQMIPEEVISFEFAYALTPQKARVNHWEHVLVFLEEDESWSPTLKRMMWYTAATRATRSLTLVI